jgi:hypothetical protein
VKLAIALRQHSDHNVAIGEDPDRPFCTFLRFSNHDHTPDVLVAHAARGLE